MALVQQLLLEQLEQRKETAEQRARKQRVEASLRRIKQLYAPLYHKTARPA